MRHSLCGPPSNHERVLDETRFAAFVARQCAKFYADGVKRPSVAPDRYFRLLLLGHSAVYANRQRIRSARGERLLRWRGEFLERPSAHLYETGTMSRLRLREHVNIRKRLLVPVGG